MVIETIKNRRSIRKYKADKILKILINDILKARIRDDVRRLLLSKGFKPEEEKEITDTIYQQALYLYKDYAPA